jgi:hypothetical protein
MQDRPFIPVTSVVLSGVPRDMKMAFRKWDERHMITQVGKGDVVLVPLNAALEATRG